ncbi:MAG: alpha/beta hydrolase fold domain-containing protein [Hyphomicrobiaceae bacterium]
MDVRIERDIAFTKARIGFNDGRGPMQEIDVALDAYLPATPATSAPALVLAFGGAFHRGSKEDDAFTAEVGRNTAIADYCRQFAARGIPSFSTAYRLAQADPEPPADRVLTEPDRIPMERINLARRDFNLPAIAPAQMAGMMEAAFEDVANAVRFVTANAGRFGIDPTRVVAGGFSAGARSAMYAAYAKRVPVAGVVALSGPMMPVDVERHVTSATAHPPLLAISGEKDLGYVCEYVPQNVAHMRTAGVDVEAVLLPGATHFYPATEPTPSGLTVIDTIAHSLERWVGPLPQ